MKSPIMKRIAFIMTVLGVAGVAANIAADPVGDGGVEPGYWQMAMELQLSDKGWAPRPFSLTQCLTLADAKDPSRILSGLVSSGASGCHYAEKDYSGNTFSFILKCSGTYGIEARGKVTLESNHFSGEISESVDTGDKTLTTFNSRISGSRLGNCAD